MLEFIVPFTDKAAAEKFDRYHGTNGELVRCKDCKYWDGRGKCRINNGYHSWVKDDWFCADGERRESE